MEIVKPFVILSAERSENSPRDNLHASAEMREIIDSYGAEYRTRVVDGVWKGTRELSYLVEFGADRAQWHIGRFSALAEQFAQDAILYVDVDGFARLITGVDPATDVAVGIWSEIPRAAAEARDAYTEFGGKFYATI